MTMNKKIDSIKKKVKNLDVIAFYEGSKNFKKGAMQKEAEQRAIICMGCDMIEKEPIAELAVDDPTLPSISEMICGDCGCALPLKLRQNTSTCPLRKWS